MPNYCFKERLLMNSQDKLREIAPSFKQLAKKFLRMAIFILCVALVLVAIDFALNKLLWSEEIHSHWRSGGQPRGM